MNDSSEPSLEPKRPTKWMQDSGFGWLSDDDIKEAHKFAEDNQTYDEMGPDDQVLWWLGNLASEVGVRRREEADLIEVGQRLRHIANNLSRDLDGSEYNIVMSFVEKWDALIMKGR